MTTHLIDGEQIKRRRRDLGLSERSITSRMGPTFSSASLRGIEEGINHTDITLGELAKLAAILDLPLQALLRVDSPGRCDHQIGPRPWPTVLEDALASCAGLLLTTGSAVPTQALAETHDLTLEELEVVLDELDGRLQQVGLQVRHLRGETFLRPADEVPVERLRETSLAVLRRRGINVSQARILRTLMLGEALPARGTDTTLQAQALRNAGVLDEDWHLIPGASCCVASKRGKRLHASSVVAFSTDSCRYHLIMTSIDVERLAALVRQVSTDLGEIADLLEGRSSGANSTLGASGLGTLQRVVLDAVADAGNEGLTASQAAARTEQAASNVTRALNALQNRGLVRASDETPKVWRRPPRD